MTSPPNPAAAAQPLRLVVLSFVGAMVIVAILTPFVVPPAQEPLPAWVLLACLAPVLLGTLLARSLGFRTAALPPQASGPEVTQTALVRFQTSTFVRLAMTDVPFPVVFALCFVMPYGPWPALFTFLPALVSLVLLAWPSRSTVSRFADALEANGARSGLREAFGQG